MKIIKYIYLFCFFLAAISAEEKPFVIVIPACNNLEWVKLNLDSVFNQNYSNYRVIYIDDATSDGTGSFAKEYTKENGQEHRVTFLRNNNVSGQLACMCQAIYLCDPEEIIVDLDGSDWLAHDDVLEKLNEVYADSEVWMTYGQFMSYPSYREGFARKIPEQVIEENSFRSFGGAVTHLRTFHARLFQLIDKEDFLFDGKFILKAGDLAYITPMLEMSGAHSHFIKNILYFYNTSDPENPHKVSNGLEGKMDQYIRSKQPYFPLIDLFEETVSPGSVYSKLQNLTNPSLQDYYTLQDFLSNGDRENLNRLWDMQPGVRSMKIIGNTPDEFPRFGVIPVNCSMEDKDCCILLYSTFNRNFPGALKRLLGLIRESDYKGHVRYRFGGWPNTEEGCLPLAHVPYAFKVSFIKEAQRLGYKRVLWLDTAAVPLVSLNDIFEAIEKDGYFIMGNSHMLGPYMNAEAAAFFGLTLADTYQIPSCSAGLFGIDFTQKIGNTIIDWWHRAARDKDAFFSARSDQSALSMIFYQLGISKFVSLDRMPHSEDEIKEDSLFWLNREITYGL